MYVVSLYKNLSVHLNTQEFRREKSLILPQAQDHANPWPAYNLSTKMKYSI